MTHASISTKEGATAGAESAISKDNVNAAREKRKALIGEDAYKEANKKSSKENAAQYDAAGNIRYHQAMVGQAIAMEDVTSGEMTIVEIQQAERDMLHKPLPEFAVFRHLFNGQTPSFYMVITDPRSTWYLGSTMQANPLAEYFQFLGRLFTVNATSPDQHAEEDDPEFMFDRDYWIYGPYIHLPNGEVIGSSQLQARKFGFHTAVIFRDQRMSNCVNFEHDLQRAYIKQPRGTRRLCYHGKGSKYPGEVRQQCQVYFTVSFDVQKHLANGTLVHRDVRLNTLHYHGTDKDPGANNPKHSEKSEQQGSV
ncbi:MAG: hypothetical protein SGARI_001291 [Bacillariaceae sp.]